MSIDIFINLGNGVYITYISHCHALIARNRDRDTEFWRAIDARGTDPRCICMFLSSFVQDDRSISDFGERAFTNIDLPSAADMNLHLFVIHM